MMAGAQNDSVAELLLALVVYKYWNLKLRLAAAKWGKLGLTLGLALLTKAHLHCRAAADVAI